MVCKIFPMPSFSIWRLGSAINQSLSALGLVIEKLAATALRMAKFREKFPKKEFKSNMVIPYRTSVLTRILEQSLGSPQALVLSVGGNFRNRWQR